MEPKFNIALVGGGNLCHGSVAAIGHFNPHYSIKVLTRRPELWQNKITGYTKSSSWENKGDIVGKIEKVSSNASEIVSDADVILICSPAHTKNGLLAEIKPFIKDGALVGTVFGQGAFDMQANFVLGQDLINQKNLTIFSLQYVPFICKVVNYGQDLNIIGPKRTLYCAAFPPERVHYVSNAMSQCYFLPCIPIPSFLNLTLCPSNQIIHPGRVIGFFKQFPELCNKVLKKKDVPLLYEDLDDESAHEMQILDDEIQDIRKALLKKYPQLNLDQVLPMKDRILTMYSDQITDRTNLKTIFNTNKGYSRVPFPMIPVPGQDLKIIPAGEELVKLNFDARFFWEDLPYGLVILKDIGDICGVKTPNLTRAIIFHQQFMPVKYVDVKTGKLIQEVLLKSTGAPSAYGITTIEQLVANSLPPTENKDGEKSKFSNVLLLKNNIFFKKSIQPLAKL